MSDSLWPHGLQHTRLPCPLATPGACSNSRPSNQWCQPTVSHPLSSASPPALIFPSIMVFSSVSVLHIKWPKYWSFSFSISLSNEYPGLISFRINWFDLLAAQGTLKSLFQHHNLKPSILQCSAFFEVQLTSVHGYWKNHSFDRLLLEKWCLCFLICCLGLSYLFFQGASIF